MFASRCAQTWIAIAAFTACPAWVLAQDGQKPDGTKPEPATPAPRKSVPMGGMRGPTAAKPTEKPFVITGDGKAETTLTMDVRKYDFAGTKAEMRKYIPSSAKLSSDKPEGLTKEPHYSGTPKYATFTIGNGTPNRFVVAIDEVEGKDAQIYLDLNGDGDLTNDGTGAWESSTVSKDSGLKNYQGTWTFTPGWTSADGKNTRGEYALNMYWQSGRESMGYYVASARTGKITIDGREFKVQLLENDGDGLYNKMYDPDKPHVVGEPISKPVYLQLDRETFDMRGTFSFGDMNILATVSDDGSKLNLAPTMKAVKLPYLTESKPMLPSGGLAPDFEAIAWKAGSEKIDPMSQFHLADFRNKKIVVLDMWATWCGPCMKGIPHMSKLAEEVKDQDVVVIALNTFDDESAFVKFATGKGKDYKFMFARDPAGRDNSHAIAKTQYGVSAIPATFIIDKSGKITETILGYSDGDTKVEDALKKLGVKFE